MNILRAATKEEVEKIQSNADLGPTTYVVALDSPEGAILATVRLCYEVDPVYFPEGTHPRLKTVFMRDVSHHLQGKGAPNFYFNIPASEEFAEYRAAVTRLGAEQISNEPELRFKRNL